MIEVLQGDCREVMAALEPESFDAIVTDPPYGLSSGKSSAQGLCAALAEVGFPQLADVDPEAAQSMKLALIPSDGAYLGWLHGRSVIEAWVRVPECAVDLQCGACCCEEEVHPKKPTGKHHSDTGGASRFFYTAKASRSDRGDGNTHPTVKPSALMEWLVRLVCPPGGRVLDPFCGSGTTLVAAARLGMDAVGIELDPQWCEVARERVARELDQHRLPLE